MTLKDDCAGRYVVAVTASFGVAMVSPGLRDFEKALAAADAAVDIDTIEDTGK